LHHIAVHELLATFHGSTAYLSSTMSPLVIITIPEPTCQRKHNKPAMRTILPLSTIVVAIYIATTPATSVPDAWAPIPDNEIRDTDVQNLGRWAVGEHVREAQDGIRFNKVLSGSIRKAYQGVNYRLIIAASNNNGKEGQYEAKLYERGSRILLYFKPAS
jgi:hypothetical protein